VRSRIIPFYDPTDDQNECARFAKPGVGDRPRNRSTDSAGAMGERGGGGDCFWGGATPLFSPQKF